MSSRVTVLSLLMEELRSGRIEVVDLTQALGTDTPVIDLPPVFAASPGLSREVISQYDDAGPAWYWNTIRLGEHTGTHFDAPVHWITGKELPSNTTDQLSADRLIAPACVIDCSKEATLYPDLLLTREHVQAWEGEHGNIPPFPAHTIMQASGRYGLASLTNLDRLPPVGAVAIAASLKIVDGSGSPLRVLAPVACD